jgi:polyhydroxybutyrate depolymerase
MEWQIGGVTREALVYAPTERADARPALVFAWHGHGGSMRSASRSFRMHEEWPEAVIVYPQGLATAGKTDPEGKKPGWQHGSGDEGDRDLLFFDAMLETMKKEHGVDEKRIYSTGHSNGGGFTYLLWGMRGEVFAAVAPSAAAGSRTLRSAKPLPLMHLVGEGDTVVPTESQNKAIELIKQLNGCEGEGEEWAEGCTLYESTKGAPIVVLLHDGGHKYPARGPALIVRFFKEHAKP